jgi:Uma2 family endonuclease
MAQQTLSRHFDDKPYLEIIEGRLREKVSPKRAHAAVQVAAISILMKCGAQRGAVLSELRVHLAADTTLVPDVSFISYERFRNLSPDERESPRFAPDVVVEVRSFSDRPSLMRKKTELYLHHGCVAVLNVDPHTRTLTLDDVSGTTAFHNGEPVVTPALSWLQFKAADLFAGLDIPE